MQTEHQILVTTSFNNHFINFVGLIITDPFLKIMQMYIKMYKVD